MIAKDMIVILQCLIGGTDENDRIDHCLNGTEWGDAKLPKIIDDHEWWRFVTPTILSIGFTHCTWNNFIMYFAGTRLED